MGLMMMKKKTEKDQEAKVDIHEEELKKLASRYVQDIVLKATELAVAQEKTRKLNANKSSKSIRKFSLPSSFSLLPFFVSSNFSCCLNNNHAKRLLLEREYYLVFNGMCICTFLPVSGIETKQPTSIRFERSPEEREELEEDVFRRGGGERSQSDQWSFWRRRIRSLFIQVLRSTCICRPDSPDHEPTYL